MIGFDTLVVGLGSIGWRHSRVLEHIGRRVATVSRRGDGTFPDLNTALGRASFDYIVIANETALHGDGIDTLISLKYDKKVLVEKPLFAAPRALPANHFSRLCVGYNLRFHPVASKLRKLVDNGQYALVVTAYVGQHLADWRHGRDYRGTSSAFRAAGGGALRDLSHELDMLLWLFGGWKGVCARIGHSGSLEIDCDDNAALVLSLVRCPSATVVMNSLDRQPARTLRIVREDATIVADFLTGTLRCGDDTEIFHVNRDDTYAAMHQAVLAGDATPCTAEQGLEVVDLIDAAERSANTGRWVVR